MKLLVVSHACITPVNQAFYAEIEKLTGWRITLVLPSAWRTGYSAPAAVSRWKDFHGSIHPLPVWKPGNIPLHLYKNSFLQLLRSEQPDVIYMHHEPYGLATFQVFLANRLTVRCPIGFYAAQNIAKSYPFPIRWMESQVLAEASFCFPVTQGALSILRARGYRGAAQVLPLAIDPGLYHPMPEWAAGRRAALGIGPAEFVVGYLGRLVEEKGIDTLLRALATIPEKPWRCVLAGSGPHEQTLRAHAAALGIADRILFPGYVPHEEAPGWLSLFDVLTLPSETRPHWKEQFGRVLTEANACGTVVIGSDSGEIPGVIADTGGGIVFPEGNVQALAAAVNLLIDHPGRRDDLARLGAESVRERYDQSYLASRFIATIPSP
jgi:glycosyltransferase involved in cell wall biosynthesis